MTTAAIAAAMAEETAHELRVYYEDTDTAGVVNHAVYVNYFERGRSEWLRARGMQQRQLADKARLFFAVRRLCVDYKKPAALDDRLRVLTRIKKLGRTSALFGQRLLRDQDTLATAETLVVCVSAKTFRPLRLPLKALFGGD